MARVSALRYIVKRVLTYGVTIWAAFTVFFLFLHLMPGNPVQRFVWSVRDRFAYRDPISRKIVEDYIRAFDLDKDLFTQYISFLRRTFLQFDFGPSFLNFPTPAQELIMRHLPWSIGLLGVSALLAWVIGLIAGTLVGWKRGSKLDYAIFAIAICMSQIPYYLAALILVLVFAYMLGFFPTRWAYSPTVTPGLNLAYILDVIHHAFLPAMSLVVVSMFSWLISTRAMTITILGEDYLLFAKAKGLKKVRILNRYVLRNVLLPQVTGLAISLGFTVNGFYLIEWIFSYPGIGSLLVQALPTLDYNTIQGIVLISIFAVLTANLIIDLIYPLIDPRIKYGG